MNGILLSMSFLNSRLYLTRSKAFLMSIKHEKDVTAISNEMTYTFHNKPRTPGRATFLLITKL